MSKFIKGTGMAKQREKAYEVLLLISALTATLAIVLISVFVFAEGYPVLREAGIFAFLFGREWLPLKGVFGIFPMIVGSIFVTAGALILGVPLAVATAIFLAEFSPRGAERIVRPAIELLAGIPSVIYGLFGMTLVVPLVRNLEHHLLGFEASPQLQVGYSVLTASIILAVMILPTVIGIAEDALHAVPREYREGSLALGATKWQTVVRVVLPTARSGIFAGIVLGTGRAIGETMAVIMVAGNTPLLPTSIFSPVRTLTSNIAIESAYASGMHAKALFADGAVLFCLIFILTTFSWLIMRNLQRRLSRAA